MNNRICYILPTLTTGGAEIQSINQLNFMWERGYNVHLIVLTNSVPLLDKIKIPKKNILILKESSLTVLSGGAAIKTFAITSKILRFLKVNQIPLCVAILPISQWVMRVVKLTGYLKRIQFKLFIYHRDVVYDASPMDTIGKKLFNAVNSLLAHLTDYSHIFISDAVKENISRHFFIRRPHVVFNSQPYQRGEPELALSLIKEAGITEKDKHFIIVIPGRLHKKKGHLFFIEAFVEFIKMENPGADAIKVIIAGGGDMECEIVKKIEEYKLEKTFILTGIVDHKLLLSLFRIADLTVIPSIHEGFGNVAVEAIMQGCLVLSSATGGLKEIIKDGENGFLFGSGNKESFKEKLKFIYSNRAQKLIREEVMLSDYIERFTLDKQVEKLLTVFKNK